MKKRIIAYICAVALLLGVLSTLASAKTNYIPTNIPKTFTKVKMNPKYTEVVFWHSMSGRYEPIMNNVVNWYNATEGKKKKIFVTALFQGNYSTVEKYLLSGNVKSLPDLVQLPTQSAYAVKQSAKMIEIGDIINADASFQSKDKLNKNAAQASTYQGKLLGLPFSNSMIVLHYNAAAFRAAGLDPNNPPKTLAEYADTAAKLIIKDESSKVIRYGASDKVDAYHLSTWIPRQKGGTAFQFDNEDGRLGEVKNFTAGTDGTLKATLTEWKKVLDTGSVDYQTAYPRAKFQAGMTAMYMDSMVQYDTIESYFTGLKDKSQKFEQKMTRIPTVNANDSIGEATGGSSIYLFDSGSAKRQDAAWQFVKFLNTVDVSAYWYVNTGYYPMNSDALNTYYVQKALASAPNKKAALKVRDDSANSFKFQEPWIPKYNEYSVAIGNEVAAMMTVNESVDSTVEKITKKANEILGKKTAEEPEAQPVQTKE